MGILWLLLLAVAKHTDIVKTLEIVFVMFKLSQPHVKK